MFFFNFYFNLGHKWTTAGTPWTITQQQPFPAACMTQFTLVHPLETHSCLIIDNLKASDHLLKLFISFK